MKRRRFLAISAAALAAPGRALARQHRWQGRAFGADGEIVLHGPDVVVRDILDDVATLLRRVEATFNLYDEASELARLNVAGTGQMSDWFAQVVQLSAALNQTTEGLFDPSVQPAWRALFEGRAPAFAKIGWNRIEFQGSRIKLQSGQKLTFNGIAQGFATDLVSQILRERGFSDILVNIGEFAGYGPAWQIGLTDPVHGHLGTRRLANGAIATSSPGVLALQNHGHILHPRGRPPQWSTVSVEAETAALADGLSTALCLADTRLIKRVVAEIGSVRRVTTVSADGNLRTFRKKKAPLG